MPYTVYKLTSPSEKVYIGITSRSVKKRWNNGIGYKRCPAIYSAIKKYGWENIKKEILYEGLTEEHAKFMEIFLIKQHKSNNRKYGYNLTEGGEGAKGTIVSEETRKKMSAVHKGNKYNLGRKLSKEHRRKISEREKGAKNPNAKKVICLETLKVYDTLTQATIETGATKITECCNHYPKHKSSNGLHWEYYDENLQDKDYKEMLERLLEEEYKNKHHKASEKNKKITSERCSVRVICIETGEVFRSIRDACEKYNIGPPNLCNCCKGKRKTANGFHWKYYEKGVKYG